MMKDEHLPEGVDLANAIKNEAIDVCTKYVRLSGDKEYEAGMMLYGLAGAVAHFAGMLVLVGEVDERTMSKAIKALPKYMLIEMRKQIKARPSSGFVQ